MERPNLTNTSYTKVVDQEDDYEAPDVVEIDPHLLYPVKKTREERQRPSKSSPRCCPCCCYIILGLVGVSLLLITVAGTAVYFWTRTQVQRFSVEDGLDLPSTTMVTPSELQLVKNRAVLFADTIKVGKVPEEDLTITVDELNAFIVQSDYLRGHAFVTSAEDKEDSLKMDLSLPMDFLPGGKGRYFVATASMDFAPASTEESDSALVNVKLDTLSPVPDLNGPLLVASMLMYWDDDESLHPRYTRELVVNLRSGSFMGTDAPQDFIDQKKNLLEDMYDDDDDDEDQCDGLVLLNGVEGVSIDSSSITIRARRDFNNDSSSAAASSTSTRVSAAASRTAKTWTDHATRKLAQMLF